MLPREAEWLGRHILSQSAERTFPMLNLGSSTGRFVTVDQPWIDAQIFGPLREQGRSVLNCDIKSAPGVDLVGDLQDERFLAELAEHRFKSVLCSNLLEHVENREAIAATLLKVLPRGGYLFISGPHSYPRHADPIDTMFRPTPEELAALFPGTRVVASEIVDCGTYWAYITRTPSKFVKSVVRLGLPFYRPKGWPAAVARLGWLFRDFRSVCLVLEKL
jgi:SAM-dependent methyltransferase